jgi:hypothetical protein
MNFMIVVIIIYIKYIDLLESISISLIFNDGEVRLLFVSFHEVRREAVGFLIIRLIFIWFFREVCCI